MKARSWRKSSSPKQTKAFLDRHPVPGWRSFSFMSKWTEDVMSEVRYAYNTSRTLLISKYTNSNGCTKDYVVGLLPPTGYQEMVKSSLHILEGGINSLRDSKPADVEIGDWIIAAAELITSFQKTIAAYSEPPVERNVSKPLVFKDGAYIYQSEEEEGNISTVIVKNLFIESQVDHTPEITASLVPVSRVAYAKSILRAVLPVGKYLAQMNFSEEKVESVKAVIIPE